MAIVRPHLRPAIDIVGGTFETPEPPWTHLGEPGHRGRLEAAISGVGRLEFVGHPTLEWGGTAFVVGPGLLVTNSIGPVLESSGPKPRFRPGQSAVVDFGREVVPAESDRVTIEEVVWIDPRTGIQLLRAALPATLDPLPLSVRDPSTLVDREVVLLGYPAFDARNASPLIQRLFHGTFDIKRLLPGRIMGQKPWGERDFDALTHDCTSTGGCGGAPLVDVETGEVVGVHFGRVAKLVEIGRRGSRGAWWGGSGGEVKVGR